MPTGYTYCIEEGASFEEFVWRTARAMMPLVHLHDSGPDAKITVGETSGRNRIEGIVADLAKSEFILDTFKFIPIRFNPLSNLQCQFIH